MSKIYKETKEAKETKESQHKLYAVDNYGKKQEFIDNGYKEYSVSKLVKELEKDKCYHMRIHKNGAYIFYGDCDNFKGTFDQFAELLINFLKSRYLIDVSKNDIPYTSNDSKPGSYHYSIPKLYASSEKLKEIHTEFYNQHKDVFSTKIGNRTQKVIDTSVYTEHWFRYPNQSKEGDATAKHIVKHGGLIDFIVEHIPKDSICINDNKMKIVAKKNIKQHNSSVKTTSPKRKTIDALAMDSDEDDENTLGKRNEMKNNVLNNDSASEDTTSEGTSSDDSNVESNDNSDDAINCDNSDNDTPKKSQTKKNKASVKLPQKSTQKSTQKSIKKPISKPTTKSKKSSKTLRSQAAKSSNDSDNDDNDNENKKIIISSEDENNKFTDDDVERLLDMLSLERCDDRDEWIQIGLCLYNIDKEYKLLWKTWSKKSKKYKAGECEEKWRGFKNKKDDESKLTIGSLLYWCKEDNESEYNSFIKEKNTHNLIIQKFPNDKLELGGTKILHPEHSYTTLNNDKCFIYGEDHGEPTMYVERCKNTMMIKCKHEECFGKIYPCKHIELTKNEINYIFRGDVTIYNGNSNDIDIGDFKRIELFDEQKINELVYKGLNGKSIPYAQIIYEIYKEDYAYTDSDDWYMYKNHHWTLLKGYNTTMRRSIGTELEKIYIQVRDHYIEEDGKNSKTVRIVNHLIGNFCDTQLTDNIMKEIKYIYLDENRNFREKLDVNQYLICFTNGVYDLKTHTFRDGRRDDYVSMTVGYDYRDKYSDNHKNLLTFLEDIQPNKVERDYLLTYIATALYGNSLELFTVLIGMGRNGKSKFVALLEKMFGDYYDTIKSQVLTSQIKDGDAPSPGLLSLANKKIVVASEIMEGTKLNTGFIKFLTGRDAAKYRFCHQNDMIKFAPKFITLLVCNSIPECDSMDDAFSKRLRCVNFGTEFVDNNPIGENQKLKNPKIDEYFDDWKQDLFLLLVEYYKEYENNKELLMPTENILRWTNQYKVDVDMYFRFLNECTENSQTHIKTNTLRDAFCIWFNKNISKNEAPSLNIFSRRIKKYKAIESVKVDNISGSGIKNLKLKDEYAN